MCSSGVVLALACSLAGACAVSLDDPAGSPSPADPDVAVLAGCNALAASDTGVIGATGRVQTLELAGAQFAIADELLATSGTIAPAAVAVRPGVEGCLADASLPPATPALELSALGAGLTGRLLGAVPAGAGAIAYVAVANDADPVGVALATWDPSVARFVVAPGYLFTADRPRYGDAALVAGDLLYAYGCRSARFLGEDCFVARVPLASAGDRTAYRFYAQGGNWTDDPDGAWPIFEGGDGLAVVARGAGVVAAYTTPLSDTIELRNGLDPSGPWSAPIAAARCELPDGAFCGPLALHPQLDSGALYVTYGIATFDPLAPAARRTRLIALPLDAANPSGGPRRPTP